MDGPADWSCRNTEDFDDLDAETQEDIEARLYGMIHYATTEELYTSTTHHSEQQSYKSVNIVSASVTNDSGSSSMLKKEGNKITNKKQETSKEVSPNSATVNGRINCSRSPLSSDKNRTSTQKSSTPSKQCPRNPFREYLVVEESKKPRLNLKQKSVKEPADIITISDDEDSRYQSINKLAQSRKENCEKNKVQNNDTIQSEGSDSDESIIFLDTNPEETDKSSSSESSDSEIEIISKSSGPINTSFEMKLNTSGSLSGSFVQQLHAPEVEGWQRFCSKKWTPEMIAFYSSAASEVDLNAMMNSIPRHAHWHLDREDRIGPDLQRNRYFAKAARGRCMNCNQFGHLSKNCPDPRKVPCCVLCGKSGHKMQSCPKKICLSCGQPNKILIECCMECRKEKNAVCMICRRNHITTQCPDLWRRYHITTSSKEKPVSGGTTLKSSRTLYCCNCAGRGHLPKDCPDVRWSKYPAVDLTICSYENSRAFLESITQNGNSSVTRSDDGSVWVIDNPNDYSGSRRAKHLKYSIPQENLSSEKQLQAAASAVMSEVKHVAITWRVQKKKRRVIVEFDGNGNTHQARLKFKKAFVFSKNSGRTNSELKKSLTKASDGAVENGRVDTSSTGKSQSTPNKQSKRENENEPNGKSIKTTNSNGNLINELVINTVNPWGHSSHRVIKVRLTKADKRYLGQNLAKFEQKHRVTITSTVSGQKLEITIHSGPQGHTSAALNAIIRCLDVMSKKLTHA